MEFWKKMFFPLWTCSRLAALLLPEWCLQSLIGISVVVALPMTADLLRDACTLKDNPEVLSL